MARNTFNLNCRRRSPVLQYLFYFILFYSLFHLLFLFLNALFCVKSPSAPFPFITFIPWVIQFLLPIQTDFDIFVVIFVVPVWWRFGRYGYRPPYGGSLSPEATRVSYKPWRNPLFYWAELGCPCHKLLRPAEHSARLGKYWEAVFWLIVRYWTCACFKANRRWGCLSRWGFPQSISWLLGGAGVGPLGWLRPTAISARILYCMRLRSKCCQPWACLELTNSTGRAISQLKPLGNLIFC